MAPTSKAIRSQLSTIYKEVEGIAKEAGFVGLSQQDVERAYLYNESLLVDYRV